jgi:hypothetical protein
VTDLNVDLEPTPKTDQSSKCPSADGGGIWQACRVLAVRRSLFGSITGGKVLACLLSAMKAVVAGWRQPVWQRGESFAARSADATSHQNAFVLVIVALT